VWRQHVNRIARAGSYEAKHPPNGGWVAAVAGATVAAAALSLYNSRTMNDVRWPGV